MAPGWRGQGVGKGLAEHFLAWACEHGAVWVTAMAYAANTGALALYERLGFGSHMVTLGQRLAGEA